MNLLRSKSRQRTTLVLDNGVARIVTGHRNGISYWQTIPLAPHSMEEGVVRDPQALGEALGAFFASERLPTRDIVTCVSGSQAFNRVFTLPAVRTEDLKNAVVYQAKREMPVPLEDLVFTWQVIEENEEEYRIFSVGVQRDAVSTFMDALSASGVRPRSLDVRPLALARVIDHPRALLGNIEADSVDIIYLLDRSPVLIRTVYFPDRAVAVQDSVERFADELQRSSRSYNDANRFSPIDYSAPLFITGGMGDYATMAGALYGLVDHTIERFESPIPHPEDFPSEAYATNIGLLLKGAG